MCIEDEPDVKFDSTFILEYTAKLFLAYCLWLIIEKNKNIVLAFPRFGQREVNIPFQTDFYCPIDRHWNSRSKASFQEFKIHICNISSIRIDV